MGVAPAPAYARPVGEELDGRKSIPSIPSIPSTRRRRCPSSSSTSRTSHQRHVDETFRTINPATGKPIAEVQHASPADERVPPHQADHAAAEPDAFRIAGRAVDGLGGLGEFIDLALVVLGGVLGARRPVLTAPGCANRRSGRARSRSQGPGRQSVIAAQAARRPKEVKATRRMKFPKFLNRQA